MRLFVTVAHPDDEAFGCGSVLAHATASRVEVLGWRDSGVDGPGAPGSLVAAATA